MRKHFNRLSIAIGSALSLWAVDYACAQNAPNFEQFVSQCSDDIVSKHDLMSCFRTLQALPDFDPDYALINYMSLDFFDAQSACAQNLMNDQLLEAINQYGLPDFDYNSDILPIDLRPAQKADIAYIATLMMFSANCLSAAVSAFPEGQLPMLPARLTEKLEQQFNIGKNHLLKASLQ